MPYCSVLGCKNDSRNKNLSNGGGISYHRFPRDAPSKQEWIKATGRVNWTPAKSSTICSEHFAKKYFLISQKGNRYLEKTAVPTLKYVKFYVQGDTPAPTKTADVSEERYMSTDSEYHTDEEDDDSNAVRLFVDSSAVECSAGFAQQLAWELRALHDRVIRLVPELGNRRLALHFRDDNNDEVEYIFTSSTKNNRLGARHANITCNECRRGIEGLRYKCLACPDYDMCGVCEALGLHHQHALIRITKPLQTRKAREILKNWCNKMREEGGEERLWTAEEAPEDEVSKRSAKDTESNSETESKVDKMSMADEETLEIPTVGSIHQNKIDEGDDSLSGYISIKVEPSNTETERESIPAAEIEVEVSQNRIPGAPGEIDPLATAHIKEEEPAEYITLPQETLDMPVSQDCQSGDEEMKAAEPIATSSSSSSAKPVIIHRIRKVAPKIEEVEIPNKIPRTLVTASTTTARTKQKRQIILPRLSVMRPAASSGRSGPVRGVLSAGGSLPRGAALVSLTQGVTVTRLGRPAVPGAAGAGAGVPASCHSAGSQRRQDDSTGS